MTILHIYTDGSHKKGNGSGYLGVGAWCLHDGVEYSLSLHCDSKLLSSYGITETACSNPTAEFVAFAEVLKKFSNTNGLTLEFHIDYLGVREWMSGAWKAKKTYIQKIKATCLSIIQKANLNVTIHHVKGHSGVKGNEKADQLATMETEYDNFDDLVALFSV